MNRPEDMILLICPRCGERRDYHPDDRDPQRPDYGEIICALCMDERTFDLFR